MVSKEEIRKYRRRRAVARRVTFNVQKPKREPTLFDRLRPNPNLNVEGGER